MNERDVRARLRALDLPQGDWVVHGSAVMVLHGVLASANDVDLIARGPAWQRALALGETVPGREDLCVVLEHGVEVWSGWLGEDVDRLIDRAENVGGVPCVSLHEVLAFKLGEDRPKDQPHIALLRRRLGLEG